MQHGGNSISVWIAVIALFVIDAHAVRAQDLRGERVDLHPVRDQVGVVTRVEDRSAWVRLPHPAAAGQSAAFMLYSDGGDTLAVGKIEWAAPIAPYEVLVTGIHAVATRHSVNPYDSLEATEAITKRTRRYGARSATSQGGVSLANGFFVRTTVAASPPGAVTEPVRAYIAALRALKPRSVLAEAIADQAARALPAHGTGAGQEFEGDVDYAALYNNLERFQRLRGLDTTVALLLGRLRQVAIERDGLRISVPADFLRSTGQAGRRP